MSSDTHENLDQLMPPDEQVRIIRRATAISDFQQAAVRAYKAPTPTNLSACDHAITWARHWGVGLQEIGNALNDARQEAPSERT